MEKSDEFKFKFSAYDPVQEQIEEMNELFKSNKIDNVSIFSNCDKINERFGEFTIASARIINKLENTDVISH